MLEELEESGSVVLPQLAILVRQSLAVLLILEFDRGAFEDFHYHRLRLFLKEDVTETQQAGQLFKLSCDDALSDDSREVFLVFLEKNQEHLSQPGALLVALLHEIGERCGKEESEEHPNRPRINRKVSQRYAGKSAQRLLVISLVYFESCQCHQCKICKIFLTGSAADVLPSNQRDQTLKQLLAALQIKDILLDVRPIGPAVGHLVVPAELE